MLPMSDRTEGADGSEDDGGEDDEEERADDKDEASVERAEDAADCVRYKAANAGDGDSDCDLPLADSEPCEGLDRGCD